MLKKEVVLLIFITPQILTRVATAIALPKTVQFIVVPQETSLCSRNRLQFKFPAFSINSLEFTVHCRYSFQMVHSPLYPRASFQQLVLFVVHVFIPFPGNATHSHPKLWHLHSVAFNSSDVPPLDRFISFRCRNTLVCKSFR